MYIAFPILKHCKNKCLPAFLKIKKKIGPIQKHIRSLDPPIKLSALLFWYLEGLIAWKQIVFVGFISRPRVTGGAGGSQGGVGITVTNIVSRSVHYPGVQAVVGWQAGWGGGITPHTHTRQATTLYHTW